MMENWKKINGFENYEVSNLGNVKRVECTITYSNGMKCKYKEKLLKFEFNRKNKRNQFYKRVTLSQNNIQRRFQVHRLVAEYFIPNPLNKKFINHIDGNPENNIVENLEWCTSSENEKHSYYKLGKITNVIIRRKIPLQDIEKIKILYKNGLSMRKIAKQYYVSGSCISLLINNKTYVKWL